MFAYALASKPCSEATNIGDNLSLRAVLWLGMKLLFNVGDSGNCQKIVAFCGGIFKGLTLKLLL